RTRAMLHGVNVPYYFLTGASCLVSSALAGDLPCVPVTPDETFTNDLFQGRWYEVGRIQTPGGGAYQEGCMCDTTDVAVEPENFPLGDAKATYSCNKNAVDGEVQSVTANLFYDGTPGGFQQQFPFPFAPKLAYNLLLIDEDIAMEYDCHKYELTGNTEYCVHFMSRTPSIDDKRLMDLIDFAESLGLNNQNITYKATEQEGCW
ncbi:unnamed protein product, partial [Meganyctiphanes norvegica]